MTIDEFTAFISDQPTTPRMPALFVGHGSPMHGYIDSPFSRAWSTLGVTLPRPRVILGISAHWITNGVFVHNTEHPKTIHDFWGFPPELYAITYPAPGSPFFAEATQKLLAKEHLVHEDHDWGLDHGMWIVLHRMYPNADIPVFQLSLNAQLSASEHYALGKKLRTLRDHGVLIMGSGNVTHNLGLVDFSDSGTIFPWAARFDQEVETRIKTRDHDALVNYEQLGEDARISIPTPDHFWPLLYILALQDEDETISFPIEGIDLGSISMRSVLIGGENEHS